MTEDKFRADGDRVYMNPQETETGISMGFHVLTIAEFVGEPVAVAKTMAMLLNKHWGTS